MLEAFSSPNHNTKKEDFSTMTYCIYMHTSPSNKNYIGLTSNYIKRCEQHQNPNNQCIAFAAAIKKYGWESFNHAIIIENISTLEEAKELETYYIRHYNTISPYGYNLRCNSDGNGAALSDITKERISKSNKGKKRSEEFKLNIKAKRTGKKHNQESKDKCSMAKIGEKNPNFGHYGDKNTMFGRTHSAETREILRHIKAKYNYTLISPDNITYTTISLHQFCKDNNLSKDIFMKYANKGIIPAPPDKCKCNISRHNATGWQMSKVLL